MFNTLLVPLDGTPQSNRVLDLAARAAAVKQSRLHVLCVVDPAYVLSPCDMDGVEPDGLTYPPAVDQTERAERVVAAAIHRLQGNGLAAEGRVCGGQPGDAIVTEARRINADVIVMGHRHLSWLQRWADPSTAETVIERAPCPVLVETGSDC
ncbi:universal stress protein [Burkholderia multivorans]|nr:universal stress protein [Burkholderia multivorans]